MKRFVALIALATMVSVTGCASPPSSPPTSPPGSQPAPKPTMPTIKNPANFRPTVLGIFREAVGPGLVVQGYVPSPVLIRVMKGDTQLDSVQVSPKDDSHFNVSLSAPKESGTEIRVQPDSTDQTVLIRGAIPDAEQVGLFYSKSFTASRLDVTNNQTLAAKITGNALAPGGSIWIEYRSDSGVLEVQELKVSKAAPEVGTFAIERQLPPGTLRVYFYTLEADGTVMLDLIVPVVTR